MAATLRRADGGPDCLPPTKTAESSRPEYLSPIKLALLGVNGVCFGGLLALVTVRSVDVPVIVLTLSTGISFAALLAGAILASVRIGRRNRK